MSGHQQLHYKYTLPSILLASEDFTHVYDSMRPLLLRSQGSLPIDLTWSRGCKKLSRGWKAAVGGTWLAVKGHVVVAGRAQVALARYEEEPKDKSGSTGSAG